LRANNRTTLGAPPTPTPTWQAQPLSQACHQGHSKLVEGGHTIQPNRLSHSNQRLQQQQQQEQQEQQQEQQLNTVKHMHPGLAIARFRTLSIKV
jgi:hypothetical protein